MKNELKILLVEDDINLGFVIQDQLKSEGFSVHLCQDGKEGLSKFNSQGYDLCLLDVMLPKKDGFSLAQDIRKLDEETPIIFLTAKNLTEDKIKGFKLGADDYITKPFSTEELLLRIKAIIRRSAKETSPEKNDDLYDIGSYRFNPDGYELQHSSGNKKLTKKESELLKLLCKHRSEVLERDLIANLIWGDDSYFVGRSMDVFITKLRKYLKEDPNVSIENIHGVGFKLHVS